MAELPTRNEIIAEMREVQKDLDAFNAARDAINNRYNELEGTERQEKFGVWAGTQALLQVLVMVRARCEGLLDDYRTHLEKMEVVDNVVDIRSVKDDRQPGE